MAASQHIDVSVLVVSYNTKELTLACLDSIVAETHGRSYEIIVVDNASTDGSAEAIAAHPAHVRLIALEENIGFARANNLASGEARGTYLLLLNPDTVVLDHAITRLLDFAECCPHARIWGGRTVYPDGRPNIASCWGRMTLWNLFCRASGLTGVFPGTTLFNGEAMGGFARDHVRHVDIVSGCFLMIERSLWQRLGGFDPLFFMYGEEADLCLRARRHGAAPVISPDAVIVHHGGASERARTDKMVRLLAAKASLIERHFGMISRPLARLLLAMWPLSRLFATLIAAVLTGRPERREQASVWQNIWTRRAEWIGGYQPGWFPASGERRMLAGFVAVPGGH